MRFKQLHTSSLCLLPNRTRIHAQSAAPPRRNTSDFFRSPTTKSLPEPRTKKVTDSDIVKCNIAITTHMRNGQCDVALRLFNSMPRKTTVSYNTMISGYLSNGSFKLAHQLFDEMPLKDLVTCNIMISGYIKNKNLLAARQLFDEMPVKDVVSWNAILSGYAQNGLVDEARRVFHLMPEKNEISWNGILAAYVQNGRIEEARRLFESKERWPVVSWNCLMSGYLKKKRLEEARQIFDRMPVRDAVSWNTMITCYAQNGRMEEARKLFEKSPIRDVFTWTAMVSGYIQNGQLHDARRIFDEMPEKNVISWNAMIAGYVQSKNMDLAGELFEAMPCRNVSSWNTMITGYAQSGDIARARNLFVKMPHRDCISWAAIIAGFAQNGDSEEALQMFIEMKRDGERLNRSAFTCVLSTCADIAAFELGKQIHGRVVKAGYEFGCYVGNALLAMYCRCGSIDEAYNVFKRIEDKDVVSWNTIIIGYARHGFGEEALKHFESMKRASSRAPDDAQNLMRSMPFEPDAATWGALLGASRIHGNTSLGEKAAEMIFALEPWNSGMYVLLSNLYASSGRWVDKKKQHMLKCHSEKLAVAYGIMKIPSGRPVRVFKNLRVCEDCHTAIKHIAKIVGRLIILRDPNRFHHFKDGVCNCGDYW
ncbi:hypothetical protein DH2020_038605 [Rehmannia glutinosa]|uniref:DYW domain-containing protein n=1 Tax=Rehmannia glutinosa TaxID=99300 RepID=A0ABR0UY35_REHGL